MPILTEWVQHPDPNLPVCYNCKFIAWRIGIGRGIACLNPANRENPELRHLGDETIIPSRVFGCDLFERKATPASDT